MRPLVEALQYAEELRGSDTLQRQRCGFRSSHKTGEAKSTRRTVPQTQSILEPTTLVEVRFKKYWRNAIATLAKVDSELRCVQK